MHNPNGTQSRLIPPGSLVQGCNDELKKLATLCPSVPHSTSSGLCSKV